MRKTLTLLVASTALTAVIGTTAWSAMNAAPDGSPRPFAAIWQDATQSLPLILASNDDDDETLLHNSADGRGSPFPGQTHPTASVTGMPSAV